MLTTILKWIAVIMMIDSGIGMLGVKIWNRRLPGINVQKIALIEASLAVLLLALALLVG